jgi:hypothetical protein
MNSGVNVGREVTVDVEVNVGEGVTVSVAMNVEVSVAVSLGAGSGLVVHVGMEIGIGGGVAVNESPLHPKIKNVIARRVRAERSEPLGEWRRSDARRSNLMIIQISFVEGKLCCGVKAPIAMTAVTRDD